MQLEQWRLCTRQHLLPRQLSAKSQINLSQKIEIVVLGNSRRKCIYQGGKISACIELHCIGKVVRLYPIDAPQHILKGNSRETFTIEFIIFRYELFFT